MTGATVYINIFCPYQNLFDNTTVENVVMNLTSDIGI